MSDEKEDILNARIKHSKQPGAGEWQFVIKDLELIFELKMCGQNFKLRPTIQRYF